ncbi:MAG: hypothetical protein ACRC10_07400 [Thermoguttaceae bacterium]
MNMETAEYTEWAVSDIDARQDNGEEVGLSDSIDKTVEVIDSPDPVAATSPLVEELSAESVKSWNRLISRTNWEKGEVIQRWRTQLQEAGFAPTIYSDEVWAKRVGSVTSQHVGRLRRVYDRFGSTYMQYANLFWSHFQAALDWEDAEMWLEGAVQNQWSVATMRIQRWEALTPNDQRPREQDIIYSEWDEDINPRNDSNAVLEGRMSSVAPVKGQRGDDDDIPFDVDPTTKKGKKSKNSIEESNVSTGELLKQFQSVQELPDDLSSSFEQLKVAILNHKLTGWKSVQPQRILTFLNTMRELVVSKED